MKKLMIAAAIVCAAAFAQAASVDWLSTYVMQPGTSSMANGYLGAMFAVQDVAVDAISAELAKGDFTSFDSFGINEKKTNASGNFLATDYASKTAGTYDFYAVILNAGTTDDATLFYVVPTKNNIALVDGEGNETTVNFGNLAVGTMSTGNWTKIESVPEPTSGLLLLLGVAGLALRRRRA